MNLNLEIVPDDQWADTITQAWALRLAAQPRLRICLPTGSTPRPVYEKIAGVANFSESEVFILDEFGLPDGDPARCDSMLQRDLLAHLETPPALVDRLDPAATDLGTECERFAAAVGTGGLGLTMLGVGTNGHIGLNEPGSMPESVTRKVMLSPTSRAGLARYGAESDTDWGLTLGMRELLASEEIWLLVRGSHKSGILVAAMEDPIGPDLPVTYLREAHNVVVWADEAAASIM